MALSEHLTWLVPLDKSRAFGSQGTEAKFICHFMLVKVLLLGMCRNMLIGN